MASMPENFSCRSGTRAPRPAAARQGRAGSKGRRCHGRVCQVRTYVSAKRYCSRRAFSAEARWGSAEIELGPLDRLLTALSPQICPVRPG